MNGNLTIEAMRSFDPAGSMARGTQMAANEMTMQGMAQDQQQKKQMGAIRQQAIDGGYDIEKHKDLLMSQGYFEEALDLQELADKGKKDKQSIAKSGLEILNSTAKIASTLGEAGWPALRGALVNSGMASEESLPTEYDEQAQKIATGLVGNTSKMLSVLKFRSGNEQKDMLVSDGQIVKTGEAYDPTKKEGSGGFEFKASDANSIRGASAGIFGGRYDPVTNEFTMLAPDTEKKVNAISAAAQRILMEEQGRIPHDEAVRLAAGKMGIDIKDLIHDQAETHANAMKEMGLSEKASRQIAADVLMRPELTDIEAGQRAYQIALRSFQGDSEEAEKVRAKIVRMRAGGKGGAAGGGQFEEGKIYMDGQGNKARYVNGEWEPVK